MKSGAWIGLISTSLIVNFAISALFLDVVGVRDSRCDRAKTGVDYAERHMLAGQTALEMENSPPGGKRHGDLRHSFEFH